MNIHNFNQSNPPSVEAFRRLGYKVKVRHLRPLLMPDVAAIIPQLNKRTAEKYLRENEKDLGIIRAYDYQQYIYPRGGQTIVSVERNGQEFTSSSRCSILDGDNRSFGIQKCLWRIVSEMHHTPSLEA